MFKKKNRQNVVYVANGILDAESVKILLESFGIEAYINEESAGRTYGLTTGPLAQAEIIVKDKDVIDAKRIIAEMELGNLEEK